MKNWKTTLIGGALALLAFLDIYQRDGGDLANWRQWVIPALLALFGAVCKDFNVSGGTPGSGVASGAAATEILKRVSLLVLMLTIGAVFMHLTSCTAQDREAWKLRLQESGKRVLKAGTDAAQAQAQTELQTLSDKAVREIQPSNP